MPHIEQWYKEQTLVEQAWYDNLDLETKHTFDKHIEETWNFLNSVCIVNNLTRKEFEALDESERIKLIGIRLTTSTN